MKLFNKLTLFKVCLVASISWGQAAQHLDPLPIGKNPHANIFKRLGSLNLTSVNLTDDMALNLKKVLIDNDSIQQIIISSNPIGDKGIIALGEAFPGMLTLNVLKVSGNDRITDEGYISLFNSLLHAGKLQVLDVSNNLLEGGAIRALDNLVAQQTTPIVSLSLSFNTIKREDLRGMLAGDHPTPSIFKKLANLTLSGCNIDDFLALNLAQILKGNDSIQEVTLTNNPLGDEGIIALGKSFGTMFDLSALKLGTNDRITDKGYSDLFQSLAQVKKLQTLDISNNFLGAEALTSLSQLLLANPQLVNVNISFNSIKDGYLKNMLSNPKDGNRIIFERLGTLTLNSCNIDNNLAKGLASILQGAKKEKQNENSLPQANDSIRQVVISNNPLGDEGIEELGHAFSSMLALNILKISSNDQITDKGYKSLFTSLKKASKLQVLDLGGNFLGQEAIDSLNDLLEVNQQITTTNINFNMITNNYLAVLLNSISNP